MRMVAMAQTGDRVDQSLEQLAPLGRQAVTDAIDELGECRREAFEVTVVRGNPSPDRRSEAGVIPPVLMKACPRRNDPLAILHGRWQRPGRCNEVGIGKVL